MNKTKLVVGIVIVLVIGGGVVYFVNNPKTTTPPPLSTQEPTIADAKNATFTVEGTPVTLLNGTSEVAAAPGSASTIGTHYFGNEAQGDLNRDGRKDLAFLITQESGGTGVFYYAVVLLTTPQGFKATNAFRIGDRIAPQSTEINESAGEVRVNYADRKPGEAMAAEPTVGATLLLKVTPDGVLEGLMK